jgi:hypothetical protein
MPKARLSGALFSQYGRQSTIDAHATRATVAPGQQFTDAHEASAGRSFSIGV